jgi:hypothetical protein
LFERTYVGLSPAAKLVFLTLASWRATVPALGLEAVLMMPRNERIDVQDAVQELQRTSFVEVTVSEKDGQEFLTVPLVASVFAKSKLKVDPIKVSVQANTELLLFFGAGQKADIRYGVASRVERVYGNVAAQVARDPGSLDHFAPLLEFVAQKYTPAWLLLASFWEEQSIEGALDRAKSALRRYLEAVTDNSEKAVGWERLAKVCARAQDSFGEVHSLVELSALPEAPFQAVSSAVNRWNHLLRYQHVPMPSDERRLLAMRLLEVMGSRIAEADATDCSRVAWLCLALHDEERASRFVEKGLALEPNNEHCLKLASRMRTGQGLDRGPFG